jgi:hypothetical protein
MLAHFDDQVTGHSGSEYTDQHVKFCINTNGSAVRVSDDETNRFPQPVIAEGRLFFGREDDTIKGCNERGGINK